MEKRKLGSSNLEVSLVGLGTNNFGGRMDVEAARPVIHKAIDLGITHFDTADIYGNSGGSETIIGEVLGPRRKEVTLATKFGKPMAGSTEQHRGSRGYIISAVEASLKRLKTDWIDLLWMHEPDPTTPIEETMHTLDGLIKAGKVRHVGSSNYLGAQLDQAVIVAKKRGYEGFVAAQDELSLTERKIEKTLIPSLKRNGISLVPYFPLGGGALTGKYRKGQALPEGSRHASADNRFLGPNWDKIEALHDFADKRGHTLLELAMSWLACQPIVASIIAGATRVEQLDLNAKSVNWKLTDEEMAEIDKITA